MIAALLLVAAAFSQAPGVETIAEIRVHGNATLSDAAVIQLSGATTGAVLETGSLEAIEKRLRDSGRFDEIQVRKRYRTLAMDQVSLVLVVHERAGLSASGEPPGVVQRLRSRLMFFPIVNYEDGYGWTYGARTSAVDVPGRGTRLSVPLSWGGTKRAALEADRTFKSGPLTRLSASLGIAQRENPRFSIDDRRVRGELRAERRFFDLVTAGADIGRTRVTFGPARDSFWTTGADLTLDTRDDPAYPTDAVLATVAWNRMNALGATTFGPGGASVDRYRVDARGYKRVFRQNVVAVRAEYDTSSAPLPPYEQWLLGGSSLRGLRAGAHAGDTRLVWSTELRVPMSSPLSTGRLGVNAFVDGGATAPHGERLADQPHYRGAGAGLWFTAAVVHINLSVARPLNGHGTTFHFGTGFTF